MLKRIRTKHPVGFCVLSEILVLGSLLLAAFVVMLLILLATAAGAELSGVSDSFLSCIQEAVGLAVAWFILSRTGKMELLRRRGSGFFNGLLVGMYPLMLILQSLCSRLMTGIPTDKQLLPPQNIFWFVLHMLLIGLTEEFIFRAVIAQTLLEKFGTDRAGIWKACLLSGVLFGCAHLSNLISSAPFGVLMQCVFAASLGTMYAAIYFRTGNIWVTVLLHTAMDFTALLETGLYGAGSVSETVSGYDASMLISVLVYLLPTAFLLRKKKAGEVGLYFGADCRRRQQL